MTLARIPYSFSTGETLTPKKLISNFQRISKDITDLQAQRYTYSSFVLSFDGVASGLAADNRTFRIPGTYDIIGIEIQYYQATTATVTLTCTATGFKTMTLDATGATTRSYTYIEQNCRVASTADFVLAVSAGTITSCKVVVHVRTSRFATEPANYVPSDVIQIAAGATISASDLNTEFTEIASAVTADTANQTDVRFSVYTRRSIASPIAGTDDIIILPSSGRIIDTVKVYMCAAATNDMFVELLDEGGTAVADDIVNGTGSTTLALATILATDTQSVDSPQDPNHDYTIRLTRSGVGVAVIPSLYVLVTYN